jgi:hypothetical protein
LKEELTRREMLTEFFSKDVLKGVVGAWYGFTEEVNKEAKKKKKLSFGQADKVIRMRRKDIVRNRKQRKEG